MLEHFPGAVGLDEAGRGPLAGPVVAGAVVLPEHFNLEGLNDSKQLTASQREELAVQIKEQAVKWAVAFVEPEEIDRLNILHASMRAMELAHEQLNLEVCSIYVDGNRIPPALLGLAQAAVKGDAKIACIAAASILAKTARDAAMVEMDNQYPGYGFASHFGYPTQEHLVKLQELGPCQIHRRSYGPVQRAMQPCLTFAD